MGYYSAEVATEIYQESFAVRWIYDDTVGKISDSQYGGLPRSSTINALVNLIHKWHKSVDKMQRMITIVFLDFRKAFDLIDHNKLLVRKYEGNRCKICPD